MSNSKTLNHIKKDYVDLTQDELISAEGGKVPLIIPVPVILPMQIGKWIAGWFK